MPGGIPRLQDQPVFACRHFAGAQATPGSKKEGRCGMRAQRRHASLEAVLVSFLFLLLTHVTSTLPVEEENQSVVAAEGGETEEAEVADAVEDYDLFQASQRPPIPPDTPRFVVKLSDDQLLCYSIEGFELFTYNIITSPNFILNAFMNISQYDDGTWGRGHTDLGFIIKVKDDRVKSGKRLFKSVVDSRKHRAVMGGFGEVDMHNGAITFTVEGAHSDIESQESQKETLRVVMDQPVADVSAIASDGRFFDVYVDDCSGLCQVETHGLIGQFLSPDIRVDTARSSLILPDRDPISLDRRTVWDSVQERGMEGQPCWYPADGASVLEGMGYEYIVEHILATSYKFSKFQT